MSPLGEKKRKKKQWHVCLLDSLSRFEAREIFTVAFSGPDAYFGKSKHRQAKTLHCLAWLMCCHDGKKVTGAGIAVRILRMIEVFQELLWHNIPVPVKHCHALLLQLMHSPISSQKMEFIIKDIYPSQQCAHCTIYFSIFLTGY